MNKIEKSCWWQEGGLCYIKPCERRANGRSTKKCRGRCEKFKSKRSMLNQYIPDEKLIIVSELAAKDEEIEYLEELLRERDQGTHDVSCPAFSAPGRPCKCGHDDVERYFEGKGKRDE